MQQVRFEEMEDLYDEYEDEDWEEDYEEWEYEKPQTFLGKVGTTLAGIGFMGFLIFASAIDGPGNDMRIVLGGLGISMALLFIGGKMVDVFEK